MTPSIAPCALVLCLALPVAAEEPAPSPAPSPSPSPNAARKRLRLDVDRHVERVLQGQAGLPRFETSVEVLGKTPELLLERFIKGFDVECGPTGGGAPSEVEMRAARPAVSPSVDFMALARELVSRLKGREKGPERYFIYMARRRDGATYWVREGRLPVATVAAVPEAGVEMVAGFPDLDSATKALRRLERGLPVAARADAAPTPRWVTSPCRVRGK